MNDPSAVAARWVEAYNSHDEGELRAVLAREARLVSPEGTFEGQATITGYMMAWVGAFGGGYTVHHITGEGSTAVIETTWRGKHTGPYPTPNGDIPPTGREIEARSCHAVASENGVVTEVRMYFDVYGFMSQLGLLQPEAATT